MRRKTIMTVEVGGKDRGRRWKNEEKTGEGYEEKDEEKTGRGYAVYSGGGFRIWLLLLGAGGSLLPACMRLCRAESSRHPWKSHAAAERRCAWPEAVRRAAIIRLSAAVYPRMNIE